MAAYGHRYSGQDYARLLETGPSGFSLRGRDYSWDEVERLEIRPASWVMDLTFGSATRPCAMVYLKDGRQLRLQGSCLEREGAPSQPDPDGDGTEAYVELRRLFEEAVNNPSATVLPEATAGD